MSNAKIWRLLRTPVPGKGQFWIFADWEPRRPFMARYTPVGWYVRVYPFAFMYESPYRVELYLAPTRGKPFVLVKSEPDAFRFSVSAYVWPVVFHVEGRESRRERRAR